MLISLGLSVSILTPPTVGCGEYVVEFNVYEGKVVNCVYPSEDLYPSEDFYPTFGNWTNLKQVSDNIEMEG